MAAQVQVRIFNGASATGHDITGKELRHRRDDDYAADLDAPIPVPSSGTNFSWRKHTKLYVVSGITGQIGNIQWYAAPAPDDWESSCKLYVKKVATGSYVQGSSSDETAQIAGTTDADLVTQSAPLVVNSASDAITTNASTGTQDYILQQMGVLSTATSGVKTGRSVYYRYDES